MSQSPQILVDKSDAIVRNLKFTQQLARDCEEETYKAVQARVNKSDNKVSSSSVAPAKGADKHACALKNIENFNEGFDFELGKTRERKAVDKLEVTFKRPDNPKKKKKRMAVKEVALKVVAKKAKKPAAASKKKKGAAERKNAKVAKAKPAGAATKKAATKPRTPKAKNPAKAKKKLSKNELISETTVAEKKMISKVAAENKEN